MSIASRSRFNAILMYCLALSSLTFRPSVCLINRNYRIPRYTSSIVSINMSIWSDETLLPSCVGTRVLITLLSDGTTLAAAAMASRDLETRMSLGIILNSQWYGIGVDMEWRLYLSYVIICNISQHSPPPPPPPSPEYGM